MAKRLLPSYGTLCDQLNLKKQWLLISNYTTISNYSSQSNLFLHPKTNSVSLNDTQKLFYSTANNDDSNCSSSHSSNSHSHASKSSLIKKSPSLINKQRHQNYSMIAEATNPLIIANYSQDRNNNINSNDKVKLNNKTSDTNDKSKQYDQSEITNKETIKNSEKKISLESSNNLNNINNNTIQAGSNSSSNSTATPSNNNNNNNGKKENFYTNYYHKKRSDLSESRERLTHIRFFYADPEIDKACEKPLIRLNPMTMMYMGVSDDNSHLLQSANYLRNELPIRLSHLIKELRNLPFIVACNPSMLEIHERCIKAFRDFDNYDKEIKDIASEKIFNKIIFDMLEMNKDLLALLCDGFKDARRYIKNEAFIKSNINRILSARLGIRLLCEHHIALNKQSNIVKDTDSQGGENSYNSNSGDSNSGCTTNNFKDENWVGIVHKKFSPKKLIETSSRMVTRLCNDKYGVSPKLKIDGHTNAKFAYIPLPLEYCIPELLKNSFRATVEHHRTSSTLPDVNVTIAINNKDFIIRIRDRGGGIPHELNNKIFDYHFSTAGDNDSSNLTNKDNSHSNSTNLDSNNNENENMVMSSPMGMICEASSTRGLAVMSGYGFGLPTSKAYAEYLSGSLTYQSMQGIGSDFYLRLPLLDIEPEMVRI